MLCGKILSMFKRSICLLLALLALAVGCSGGTAFVPDLGAFAGQFISDSAAIGNFSVNVTTGSFGGGGSLVHNSQNVEVAISATITGSSISGRVENASLGHGSFTGHFVGGSHAEGEFTYTDAAGLSTTSGTWLANHN